MKITIDKEFKDKEEMNKWIDEHLSEYTGDKLVRKMSTTIKADGISLDYVEVI